MVDGFRCLVARNRRFGHRADQARADDAAVGDRLPGSSIRFAGIVYIVIQATIWHSFYLHPAWHLAAPVVAVAWAVTVTAYLRRLRPSPLLACLDSAFYLVLALTAQAFVPSEVRDSAVSWLVIVMSGQLIVPAWYATGALSALLSLTSPLAYWVGARLLPVTNLKTMTAAAVLLLAVGLVHGWLRWVLYGRAAAADTDVDRADQAAREQYAVLCRNIERRKHERLLHDTVLNTLTALARGSGDAGTEVVTRCRQDVALMEAALGGADDLAASSVSELASGDLLSEVRAVVADTRARGLTVHLEDGDTSGTAVPARVALALSSVVREALSNVAEHAGTGEAWVSVRLAGDDGTVHGSTGHGSTGHDGSTVPDGGAGGLARLRVVVRDRGRGFDPARIDQRRLGLRRSITERTAECGGQASIWSKPGQGAKVTLSWPAPGYAGAALAGYGLVHEDPPW